MVEFTGLLPHDKTIAAIKGARFLIFSSEWYETFGLTMIEAFACGVPVICSRMGAMQEIVDDGRTGLHFTPGDSRGSRREGGVGLESPGEMQRMGEEARREYESKYTAEKNYPRLMEIYQHAIAACAVESSERRRNLSDSATVEANVGTVTQPQDSFGSDQKRVPEPDVLRV